jgi:hypothetical protein
MPEGKEQRDDLVLLARPQDETTIARLNLARSVLEEFGFTVEFVSTSELATHEDPDEDNNPEGFRPKFQDLTNPNDYFLREHMDDYHTLHPYIRKASLTRAFSRMIVNTHETYGNYAYYHRRQDGLTPILPMSGLEVILDRTSLGFPPYKVKANMKSHEKQTRLKDCAIRAGSIVTAAQLMDQSRQKLNPSDSIVKGIAFALEQQFEIE